MHDIDTELVTEFAKDLTWEERYNVLKDNQYYITGKQYHKLWRINGKVDVIVTDTSLLLGLLYGGNKEPACFKDTLFHLYNTFNNKNYFLCRKKKYNHNGRTQTEEESKEIDEKVLEMLVSNDIPFNIIVGGFEGANIIASDILKLMGRELEIGFKPINTKKDLFAQSEA